jgi:CheY-like chemotaxis protein
LPDGKTTKSLDWNETMKPLSKSQILLADHDQTFLDQLTDRLLRMDMEVDFAENGKTALKLVETETYDLIIAEIAMPVFNGLEILRKAKTTNPHTPVLILTYEMTQDWADQAIREGAYEYLMRPMDTLEKFDVAVRKGLELAQAMRPEPSIENTFSREIFDSLPQTQVRTASSTDRWEPETQFSTTMQPSVSPVESSVPPEKTTPRIEPAPWEQMPIQETSLPEGMMELNEKGQIVTCSPSARNWLMLESSSREKPIKGLIQSIGQGKVPDYAKVRVSGRQVHLITKTIQDRNGTTRYILVIREAKAASQVNKTATPTRVPVSTHTARPSVEQKISFSSSMKKYEADPSDQGWSPVGFFDTVKNSIKDEVEKLKEQKPLDLFNTEPEEADPDTIFTMSRRISDVSRGRRTSF